MKLKGLDTVMRNLNGEIRAVENRTMKGLMTATIHLRNDMGKTPPLVPKDTGNLEQSWFNEPIRQKDEVGMMIGFSANYAMFVHERVDKNVNWQKPGSGPKFFEKALRRNRKKILQIIRDNAKIKD